MRQARRQLCFNLRREANPLATPPLVAVCQVLPSFQSQARSQSPGDKVVIPPFLIMLFVSISGEKPIPWRLNLMQFGNQSQECFNLRREANPLATAQVAGLTSGAGVVSISGEKPIPWRPRFLNLMAALCASFNLRREANPLATWPLNAISCKPSTFQSQARSQSPGDWLIAVLVFLFLIVSISGEKPIPWRHGRNSHRHDTYIQFQSQARSQSPGDMASQSAQFEEDKVSISGEKPIPWRRYQRHIC